MKLLLGPGNKDDAHVLNLGVVAHITAASPGEPRCEPDISSEERALIKNGIWLCKKHADPVDKDYTQFGADTLLQSYCLSFIWGTNIKIDFVIYYEMFQIVDRTC